MIRSLVCLTPAERRFPLVSTMLGNRNLRYPVEAAGTVAVITGLHRKLWDSEEKMDKPEPKETKGVPWADHNETESTEPDTRREEYGAEAPDEVKGDLQDEDTESADYGSSATERPTDEDRGDVEHDL